MEDFKDILVSYKTALKAKNKGFHCFVPHHYLNEHTIIAGWIQGDRKPTGKEVEQYLKDPEICPVAPTQQILREWLDRKKKVSVFVTGEFEGDVLYYIPHIANIQKKIIRTLSGRFRTHKAAMEAGLSAALD